MKGDLSLEYIGKFIIMSVALLIAVGIILKLSSTEIIPQPQKCEGEIFMNLHEPDSDSTAAKIANIIDLCYKCYEKTVKERTCKVLKKNYAVNSSQIAKALKGIVAQKTIFDTQVYDEQTVIIVWLAEGKVLVKE
jgi:hypothetical protein